MHMQNCKFAFYNAVSVPEQQKTQINVIALKPVVLT